MTHRHLRRLLPVPVRFVVAVALLLTGLFVLPASATDVTAAIVHDSGCTAGSWGPDDDGGTGPQQLPFPLHLYGATYNDVYVNTNGAVSFGGLSPWNGSDGWTSSGGPVIGPLSSDVLTYYSSPVTFGTTTYEGHLAYCVNWVDVGAYGQPSDLRNSVQLLLVQRSDIAPGASDIVFNYGSIGIDNGITAGFSNGAGNWWTFPGSGQGGFADGQQTALVSGSTDGQPAGRYVFAVRDGQPLAPHQQAISMTTPASMYVGDADVDLAATSTSGLPVTVDAVGPCTVVDGHLHAVDDGTCTLTANQPGDGLIYAAAPVVRTVDIRKQPLTVVLSGLAATYDGQPHPVVATVTPDPGAPAVITYDGSSTAPSLPGSYAVHASAETDVAAGTADGTLVIAKLPRIADLVMPTQVTTDGSYSFAVSGDTTGAGFGTTGPCSVDGAQLTLTPQHVGTCVVTMTVPGDAVYEAAVASRSVTIVAGTAIIELSGLTQAYDGMPHAPSVSSYPSGLTGVTLTYDGSSQPPTEVGTHTVHVTLDNPDWVATPFDATMTIGPAGQTITFDLPDTSVFGAAPLALDGQASSGLPVSYSVMGPCHLDGAGLVADHTGTCAVIASQAGDDTTAAASSVTDTVTITSRSQALTFSAPAEVTFEYDGPITPAADTDAGLPVVFETSGACHYDDYLYWDYAGECTVTASQPGDADTLAAVPVTRTITVQPGTQSVSLYAPDSIAVTGSDDVVASSYLGLPVTLAVTGPCSLDGDIVTGTGIGTCHVTASQAGNRDYLPATASADISVVAAAAQTIVFPALPDVRWGEPAAGPAAGASSYLDVTLTASGVCDITDGILSYSALGTCTVTATQPGGSGFAPAPAATESFAVLPGAASVDLFDLVQTTGHVHAPGVITTPDGLATALTYNGRSTLPTSAGRYLVRATVTDPHYEPAFLEAALEISAAATPWVEPQPVPTKDSLPSPSAEPTPTPSPSLSESPPPSPSPVASPVPSPLTTAVPSRVPSPAASPLAAPVVPAPSAPSTPPVPAVPSAPTAAPSEAAQPTAAPVQPLGSPSQAPATPAAQTTAAPAATPDPSAAPEQSGQEPVLDPSSGERPEPPPGESSALLDGRPTSSDTEVRDDSVEIRAGSVTLSVAALGSDGATHRPGEDATLRLDRGGNLRLEASGYEPGAEVVAWVFSDPVRLGAASAGPDGSVDATFPVPGVLPGGKHTLQVNGQSVEGLRTISLGLLIDDSGVPLWQAADHPEAVAATQVALFALAGVATLGGLGAIGASAGLAGAGLGGGVGGGAGGAAAGSGGSSSEQKSRKSGKLAAAKVKHVETKLEGEAFGDRSPTWRLPGTSRVDGWSARWPGKVGAISPLLARLLTDGSYLRAILGSGAPAAVVVAAGAGAVAALRVGSLAAPEALLVGVVLVLGVLDAFAGAAAAIAFLTTLLLRGDLASADAARGSLGVAAMWFALPLLVGETRPLRREAARSVAAGWYRLGDLVVLPLLAAWLTLKLVGAFSGLYGHAVAVSSSSRQLALVAGGAVLARLLVEEIAARLYPQRLTTVAAGPIPGSSRLQKLSAVGVRTGLFVFVAMPFVGLRWQLAVGALMFCLPQVGKVFESRLPNVPLLHRTLPSGLVKLTGLVVLGWWLSTQLKARVQDPRDLAALGFIVLAMPPFVQGVLGLFGRTGTKPQPSWLRRCLGAVVVTASVWIVYTLTVA